VLARGRRTAPCLLPQANRAPAARCVRWRRAQAPGPSLTTTRRRRAMRSLPHACLRRAAQARRFPARGVSQRKTLRRRAHAREQPKLGAKPPNLHSQACAMRFIGVLCTECSLDEFIPRHVSGPRFAERTCEREQHPDALQARPPCLHHALHDGTHPRRAPQTLAQLQHSSSKRKRSLPTAQSGAPRACSEEGMRFPPPPSAQGYLPGVRHAPPERAQRAPPWSEGAGLRSPQQPVRRQLPTRVGRAPDRAQRAHARPSSRCPIRRRRRASRCRACAAFTRSPCFSSAARAAWSAFGCQPRSRDTSAISASATAHRARATGSLGPKARRSTSQESLRAHEIAELRHRDTAKRESRRVVTQANPLQYAEEGHPRRAPVPQP